jgi:hypothetical protein
MIGKREYSKMWCEGFCRTCGTSCADHSEDLFEVRAERDRYKALAESRPTGERYRQLRNKMKRQYERICQLEEENRILNICDEFLTENAGLMSDLAKQEELDKLNGSTVANEFHSQTPELPKTQSTQTEVKSPTSSTERVEPSLITRLNTLLSDAASCDRDGCRCWQAVDYLKQIRQYADDEIERAQAWLAETPAHPKKEERR